MTNFTPKLTNVSGVDGTVTEGYYAVEANGTVTFTAQIVAKHETNATSSGGFGLTLPVPAKTGTRVVFNLEYDGRDADGGVWAGNAIMWAGSDGKSIDRMRTPGTTNASALRNITHMYGDAEGATDAEIITVSGSYIKA
ncbi:hypothetical protein [Streptomyces sp. BH055]|uniref:hypothetical protein n=1 Tax=unclassified Streptomyces TaxID=2593676 RepID=UPI003BB50110